VLVTGGAGFIGSNLVDRLLANDHTVTVFDNLSTGRVQFLEQAAGHPRFMFIRGDLLDHAALCAAVQAQDAVFHLAANADVRRGTEHPRRDLEQNTIATHNVLEAARLGRVGRVYFTSTGSVYGEPAVFPTPEDCPFPIQTSLYGASKVACEALMSAYSQAYGMQCVVFRFVSILGQRYTHGHVFDFLKKLRANPRSVEVLGNGKQSKSYLDVQDCLDAVLLVSQVVQDPFAVFNLGNDGYCTVDESLSWICDEIGLSPGRQYTGGERGWVGDSPLIHLDCTRMRRLGWTPQHTIEQSVRATVRYLLGEQWLLEEAG